MKIKSVLNQNLFIDYDILYDTGEHISSSLAGADGTLQSLNGLMGQIAALVSGVPAKARCASLQASCLKAQSEIQGIDLNSYGNRASRSLYLLADRSQSVDREIAKNLSHNIGAMGFLKNEINGLVKEAAFRSYRDRSSLLLMGSSQRAENDEREKTSEDNRIFKPEEHPYSLSYQAAMSLGISLSASGVPSINNAVDARDYTQVMCLSLYGKPGEEVEIHRNGNVYTFQLLPMTYDEAVDKQAALTGGSKAKVELDDSKIRDDIYVNMLPYNNTKEGYMYQFVDLRQVGNLTVDEANQALNNSDLAGTGQIFIDAGKEYSVNPAYLICQSLHETGNGTSALSTGNNEEGAYNMFGIGANDGHALEDGAKAASDWNTQQKGIQRGAEWIANHYIYNDNYDQVTLYDMRWNTQNPAQHQYATDVCWAQNQIRKALYDAAYDGIEAHFYIPVYMSEGSE